ncbi:hypothetical protein SUDANB6_00029 [Streptomyces sp. enrichment culture]
MRADLVTDALTAAERTRGSLTGAVLHTDHGTQRISRAFADACRQAGVHQYVGAIGGSADNALAESFNATFERETLQGRKTWSSERDAPPRRVPLAQPIQDPTPTLPPRTTQQPRPEQRRSVTNVTHMPVAHELGLRVRPPDVCREPDQQPSTLVRPYTVS